MRRTIRPEPPVSMRLQNILRKIYAGEILVPRFQRPFVWTDRQRLLLVDSVRRGLPIGSIITWRASGLELGTYPSLGGVPLPHSTQASDTSERPSLEYETYLLDGHQRLATLYSALGQGIISADNPDAETSVEPTKGDEPVRAIYLDLVEDALQLQPQRGDPPTTWLPLRLLFDRHALRKFEDEQLFRLPEGRQLIHRVQDLLEAFSNYEIPVLSLATSSLDEATEVFQRINSTGEDASQFHMVSARLWRPEFDLQEAVESMRLELEPHGWGELSEQMILNTCKALLDLDIYNPEVSEIADAIQGQSSILERTTAALIAAAEFLRTHCDIAGPGILPYSYQMVLLADAIARAGSMGDDVKAALSRWLWATTYAELFGGLSTSRLRKTLDHVRLVATAGADPLEMVGGQVITPVVRFDFRAARSRALALRMALELRPIDQSWQVFDAPLVLAREGVRATPMLYSARELDDAASRSGPENRLICRPEEAANLRWLLKAAIADTLDPKYSALFLGSHAFTHGRVKDVVRQRRIALHELERRHVEFIGLTYVES